ncbi:hypothetical protein BV898_01367 [Hypsibius exemplaris]|uniref:Uncharacterized protein n=1 Tax=Hypsibius exemplaris TaxID=2072580 RepID=A0A1W0XB96_HYPEX|nr:hypothetical protein BV898_01367 [Hypsibius exemplaris]
MKAIFFALLVLVVAAQMIMADHNMCNDLDKCCGKCGLPGGNSCRECCKDQNVPGKPEKFKGGHCTGTNCWCTV